VYILASNIQIVLSLAIRLERNWLGFYQVLSIHLYWLSFSQHCLQKECGKRLVPLGNGLARNLTEWPVILFLSFGSFS